MAWEQGFFVVVLVIVALFCLPALLCFHSVLSLLCAQHLEQCLVPGRHSVSIC